VAESSSRQTLARDTVAVASGAPARPASGPRPPLDPGAVVQGRFRYRLDRRLGTGGFGSVFLAQCLDHEREGAPPPQVALKILAGDAEARALSSLKRELAALRAVDHPHIPRLYDWQVDGDVLFVALEYFPGGSLADVLDAGRRLDEEQTWRLITDLLSALRAAHGGSILHLDVKPSNVLIGSDGGYVLTDFGVSQASRMSKGLMHQGQIPIALGTHGYRAPEQASATVQSFDLRTDLWGVGATAWAMVTGVDLNRRQDVLRTREKGNIYGLQRLSDVHLFCPPPLEEVVMGLLFIDPDRRPGGASEVLAQIRTIAAGFGLDSQTVAAARRNDVSADEIRALLDRMVDPLWASICRAPGFERYFVKFEDGELLSGAGEQAHHTMLLIEGVVRVERGGVVVAKEEGEGTMLGAISTFSGAPRRSTLRAEGTVWTCLFNEAELEQLVTCNPSVAVRLIRAMALRIASGPPRHAD